MERESGVGIGEREMELSGGEFGRESGGGRGRGVGKSGSMADRG